MNRAKTLAATSAAILGAALFALLQIPSQAVDTAGTTWSRFKRDAGSVRQLFLQSPGTNNTYDFTADDALFVTRVRLSYQSSTAASGSQRLQVSIAAPPDRTVPLAYFYLQAPGETVEYSYDPPLQIGAGARIVPTVTGESPFLIEFFGTSTAPAGSGATGAMVR
ncbi:MAG: hypothetical protein SF028_12170 [Candidatus Sumerlaeia bacterium]|nr:hypothetical protein [Candidatus Sumerlaeia bacterium]